MTVTVSIDVAEVDEQPARGIVAGVIDRGRCAGDRGKDLCAAQKVADTGRQYIVDEGIDRVSAAERASALVLDRQRVRDEVATHRLGLVHSLGKGEIRFAEVGDHYAVAATRRRGAATGNVPGDRARRVL